MINDWETPDTFEEREEQEGITWCYTEEVCEYYLMSGQALLIGLGFIGLGFLFGYKIERKDQEDDHELTMEKLEKESL